MLNKKIVKSILLVGLVLVCVVGFSPKARAITASELQAQITLLLAQVKQLQEQLAGIQGNQGVAWCHSFNANLRIENKGSEVEALQTALSKDGAKSWEYKGYDGEFDEMTASAVVEFQEKYASEILGPYGLKRGTGFVGKSTRAKLNKLYGCNGNAGGGGGGTACAADAKQCSDGSYVSRTGPNCEFAPCPANACVKEGEKGGTESSSKFTSCCSGLQKTDLTTLWEGVCDNAAGASIVQLFTCINCGNGVCGLGENKCNCPSDCKDTAAITACTDTDSGLDYYTKGTVTINGVTNYTDSCSSIKDYVKEYLCEGTGDKMISYLCPNGCYDGACEKSASLPDLKILSFAVRNLPPVASVDANYAYFDITVQNIGTATAYVPAGAVVGLYKNSLSANNAIGQARFDPAIFLAPNTTYAFRNITSFSGADLTGITSVIAQVDDSNIVVESNESNNDFRIAISTPVVSSLKVLSPNAGEALNTNPYIISWKAANMDSSKLNIDLVNQTCLSGISAASDTEQCVKAISHGVSSAVGQYTWTNSSIFFSGTWKYGDKLKVRLTEVQFTGAYGVKDESDVDFSVTRTSPCASYGDVNSDGYVNKVDSDLILQIAAGVIAPTESQKKNADVSGNGTVSAYDSGLVLQYIDGQTNTFPVCSQ